MILLDDMIEMHNWSEASGVHVQMLSLVRGWRCQKDDQRKGGCVIAIVKKMTRREGVKTPENCVRT